MKHHKRVKMQSKTHFVLFRSDLPFGHKVERDRTKYTRKTKHRGKDSE